MRFAPYLSDLHIAFPCRYGVNWMWTALPYLVPHIRFLFVRLAVCYRLPSSIRCLLDSAELLVLLATGRTVDFHHTITHSLPGAPQKTSCRKILQEVLFIYGSLRSALRSRAH